MSPSEYKYRLWRIAIERRVVGTDDTVPTGMAPKKEGAAVYYYNYPLLKKSTYLSFSPKWMSY